MLRTPLAVAAFACLILQGCGRGPGPSPAVPRADPPQVAASATAKLTGTLSCSGRGCHGELARPDAEPWRVAYTRWLHSDPHTNAYRVLEGQLGREIGRKLDITPTEDARCLACHMTPQAVGHESASTERDFGVGCESCHGSAQGWLVEHREAGWKAKPAVAKEMRGMNSLEAHARRAEVCAGCHVGAPADPNRGLPLRDMNHDMIAAGHPRLLFEYGSYLANLPKHWKEKGAGADFDSRAWLVGQLATAQAAMALLADRAARAGTSPWPEFAEHDCFACHHGLRGQSWRRERGYAAAPGSLLPNRWATATLPAIAPALGGAVIEDRRALDGLLSRRVPPAGKVKAEAVKLAERFGSQARALEDQVLTPELTRTIARSLRDLGVGAQPRGWDEYEQAALGLAALGGEARPKMEAILRRLALTGPGAGPEDGPGPGLPADMRKLFGARGE